MSSTSHGGEQVEETLALLGGLQRPALVIVDEEACRGSVGWVWP
jgi:hypothetical protein